MSENSPVSTLAVRENFLLDDRIRGEPPGTSGLDGSLVASERWHPAMGACLLPVLTLDEAAFAGNRELFLRYAREQGVAIAPRARRRWRPTYRVIFGVDAAGCVRHAFPTYFG
jgi:D-serine dehydratase